MSASRLPALRSMSDAEDPVNRGLGGAELRTAAAVGRERVDRREPEDEDDQEIGREVRRRSDGTGVGSREMDP